MHVAQERFEIERLWLAAVKPFLDRGTKRGDLSLSSFQKSQAGANDIIGVSEFSDFDLLIDKRVVGFAKPL